jgi:cytosine/adenosine deaminase-related metal-dependent hydrolase
VPRSSVLSARALLVEPGAWIEGGGLLLTRGRVVRVLPSRASARRAAARAAKWIDLGDSVLTPGLIDAHAHLELTALAGRVSPGSSFAAWIGSLLRERARLARPDFERGVRAGLAALRRTGTTAVGDIDSSGASWRLARALGSNGVVYREWLDIWDAGRRARLFARPGRFARRGQARVGLSPHAPYTTSDELLAAAARLARARSLPLAIHWAETSAEGDWLRHGTGPLAALLPASPHRRGLERLERAGLLTPRTVLVHGNHPARGEPELLARRGVALVHCPGTHAFFAREGFPLARYLAAGVPLALGTDSLASNASLDMRREMALLREAFPRLAPAQVFAMATEGGARALGRADLGHARPGAQADLAAWRLAARDGRAALEELTRASPAVRLVFLAGRALSGAKDRL